MSIIIKKMETADEIKGKAFVAWRSWHEAYTGLVSQEYLDNLTLEKCEKVAFSLTDDFWVAKDNNQVVGFIGFGNRGEEAPEAGEIFTLYVLSDYYGKGVGRDLMNEALQHLQGYSTICLWVFKENKRAIHFYQRCGFYPDGTESFSSRCGATEIRMVLAR